MDAFFNRRRKLESELHQIMMKKTFHTVMERRIQDLVPVFHLAAQLFETNRIIRNSTEQQFQRLLGIDSRILHTISLACSSASKRRPTLAAMRSFVASYS